MPPVTPLRALPRYRDPISRNVARLLLRSLQEQHRAPSSTVIEFETRFGSMQGQVTAHRLEFPVSTITAAILDPLHKRLYSFAAGVSRPIFKGVEMALLEKDLAAPADFANFPPHYRQGEVQLLVGERRYTCDYASLDQLRNERRVERGSAAAPLFAAEQENPHFLHFGIVPRQAMRKTSVAILNMCCPGWCADLRFVVSSEEAVPLRSRGVLERPPDGVRYRARRSFKVSPFFAVHVSQSVTHTSLWWFPPSHRTVPSATTATDAQDGAEVLIACPRLHRALRRAQEYLSPTTGVSDVGVQGFEVEVEVDVPALLRAWKRLYGGAAASAYLDTAALSRTTLAGTYTDAVMTPAELATAASGARLSAAEVHAVALAEREDPFLLRVAEDYLALLQFLAQMRVME